MGIFKIGKLKSILCILLMILIFAGCSKQQEAQPLSQGSSSVVNQDKAAEPSEEAAQTKPQAESEIASIEAVKPNESGQIMVVMFHNFIETYTKGDKEFTTTFSDFEKLLSDLYEKKYRLVNLTDLLNNNINIPAGCIPMVFTFDDGTKGEFNLIESNGQLDVNPKSAVGIMKEFNRKHPDFGMKGTFYVNLGVKTFEGSGTLKQRLEYLVNMGFEIGNHTKNHVSLPSIKSAQKIMQEVGGNQQLMLQLVPGYYFNSFSLPFGGAAKNLTQYVIKGEYEGVKYENRAIMLVGANPAPSPVSPSFNPLQLPRVRSNGLIPVQYDLNWWISKLQQSSQYVSDGNPDTITVPVNKKKNVDITKLGGKRLITY